MRTTSSANDETPKTISPASRPTAQFGTSMSEDSVILQKAGLSEEDRLSLEAHKNFTKSLNFVFGERFTLIDAAWGNTQVAVTRLKLPRDLMEETSDYIMHPCIIDACLQIKVCLELQKSSSSEINAVPSLPIGRLITPFCALVAAASADKFEY